MQWCKSSYDSVGSKKTEIKKLIIDKINVNASTS